MKEDGREAWTAEMLACDLERTIGRIPPGKLSCYLSSLLAACREQGRIDPRVFSRCEEENADALEAIAYIASSHEEMGRRVMSARLFGNSKHFERKTERNVLRILRGLHGDIDGDEMLRLYGICGYPEVFEFTGPVTVIMEDGSLLDFSHMKHGAYINSETIAETVSISAAARRITSIENKSNYIEYARHMGSDEIAIFTGGSFSRARSRFLSLFPYIPWRHWGDIDIGGMRIFLQLKRIRPGARPYMMDAMTLLGNAGRGRALDGRYREELAMLLEDEAYSIFHETILMMLDLGIRLEQEALL